jgi:hypothetical protein
VSPQRTPRQHTNPAGCVDSSSPQVEQGEKPVGKAVVQSIGQGVAFVITFMVILNFYWRRHALFLTQVSLSSVKRQASRLDGVTGGAGWLTD